MNPYPVTPDEAWNQLVAAFRRVCLMRREGRLQESGRALADELPRRIVEWARLCPLDAARKRADLEAMMRDEQRRLDEAWWVQHLVVQRVTEEVVPALVEAISQEVHAALGGPAAQRRTRPELALQRPRLSPARVRFEDVQGMIDQVLDQETRAVPSLQPV